MVTPNTSFRGTNYTSGASHYKVHYVTPFCSGPTSKLSRTWSYYDVDALPTHTKETTIGYGRVTSDYKRIRHLRLFAYASGFAPNNSSYNNCTNGSVIFLYPSYLCITIFVCVFLVVCVNCTLKTSMSAVLVCTVLNTILKNFQLKKQNKR